MKSTFRHLGIAGLGLAVLAGGFFASEVRADHHRLHEALKSLLEAREAMVTDGDSYGGHREKAMKSLETTIDEVRKAIEHEDREDRPHKKRK